MDNEGTFKLKYKFAKDYDPVFVNGVHGSLNISGEAVLHFFYERLPLPNQVELFETAEERDADVRTLPEDLDLSFVRMIKTGVIMQLDQLRELRDTIDELLADDLINEDEHTTS